MSPVDDDQPLRDRSPPEGVRIREGRPDDRTAVLGILDGAALATDRDAIVAALQSGDSGAQSDQERDAAAAEPGPRRALVAERTDGGPLLGALVLVGDRIAALAVRPGRRGQGIGAALVAAAARRRDRLTGRAPAAVREFYETLGFDVSAIQGDDAVEISVSVER